MLRAHVNSSTASRRCREAVGRILVILLALTLMISEGFAQGGVTDIQTVGSVMQSGDYARAEAIYRKLLKTHPNSPEILAKLGIALHFEGKTPGAIATFNRALQLKQMPGALAMLSLDYCKLQQYGEADAALRHPRRFYHDSNVLVVVAPCYLHAGDPMEGIHVYRELLKRGISPTDEYQVDLSRAYMRATQHYSRLLQDAPRNDVYVRALRKAQINSYVDNASVIAESVRESALQGAPYVRAGMPVEELAALVKRHPRQAALLYLLVLACGRQAIATFRCLELEHPDSSVVHTWNGDMYASVGRYQAAIKEYKTVIRKSPNNPDIHHALAKCFEQLGHWENALQEYRQESALSPHDERALRGIARCLIHLGQFEELTRILGPIVNQGNPSFWSLTDFAEAEERLGNVRRAIECLEKAIKLNPASATAHYRLSALYRQIHRSDLASQEAAEFGRLKRRQRNDTVGSENLNESKRR